MITLGTISIIAIFTLASANEDEPPVIAGPVPLYEGTAPGTQAHAPPETPVEMMGHKGVRNVSVPTLTPVLPPKGKATGAAVIIAPGGGYVVLSLEDEGFKVARWFAAHGVAAFVLKYRLNLTPVADADFWNSIKGPSSAPSRATDDYEWLNNPLAVADGLAALRLVRARATEWGVDSKRLGILGFSAGAVMAVKVATMSDDAARPAFVASIYGSMQEMVVPSSAPPLFIVLAADDPIFASKRFGLIDAWQRAGRPVEFHFYERGGHGFDLGSKDLTSGDWPEQFLRWLKMRAILPVGHQ